jgi:hypothetical protein
MEPSSRSGIRVAVHMDAILVLAIVALVAVLLELLLVLEQPRSGFAPASG